MLKILLTALLVSCLSGCVSVDSSIWMGKEDAEASKNLSGFYPNIASYYTRDGFRAARTISEILARGDDKADTVRIDQSSSDLLKAAK